MSKSEGYRDALELWVSWWNGPGREDYRGVVLPPITLTGDLLQCRLCQGVIAEGERCAACDRRLER